MKAQLILENGKRFCGTLFGATREVCGEVIFTTEMVGYQEIITNPSYAGQIVVMTFPLIGNYGINLEDMESDSINLSALIVREKCDYPSNFRSEMTLDDFLKKNNIVGIEGIDTRALTKTLRDNGSMKGVIITGEPDDEEINKLLSCCDNSGVITKTTTKEKYVINDIAKNNVAFIDMGVKDSILREIGKRDCKITVFPASVSSKEILDSNPDLVFVSDGPGNPENAQKTIETIKNIIGKVPVSGVSLGHQIIGLALGAKTEKLKYGHHGANQPVKDLSGGGVYITSQNHNYILTELPDDVNVTFTNVNDGSCEGIRHKTLPVESFQFIPETTSNGVLDISCLIDKFLKGDK